MKIGTKKTKLKPMPTREELRKMNSTLRYYYRHREKRILAMAKYRQEMRDKNLTGSIKDS